MTQLSRRVLGRYFFPQLWNITDTLPKPLIQNVSYLDPNAVVETFLFSTNSKKCTSIFQEINELFKNKSIKFGIKIAKQQENVNFALTKRMY